MKYNHEWDVEFEDGTRQPARLSASPQGDRIRFVVFVASKKAAFSLTKEEGEDLLEMFKGASDLARTFLAFGMVSTYIGLKNEDGKKRRKVYKKDKDGSAAPPETPSPRRAEGGRV